MKDKICLITGATSGVGKAIALGLARLGATLVLLSRDRQRGIGVAEEIRSRSANDDIDVMTADLSVQDSIRRFADKFERKYDRLHVLSNNAAIFTPKRQTTVDGMERILATNYLSHFLLTNLLLALLEKSAPSRVITVSGGPGILRFGKIYFDDIQCEKRYNPFKATAQAAFAKVAFTFELAKRMKHSGVASHTFHPGLVKSNLARSFPRYAKPCVDLFELFLREECKTGVYVASSTELDQVTGGFYMNMKPAAFRARNLDARVGSRLWEISEELTRGAYLDEETSYPQQWQWD